MPVIIQGVDRDVTYFIKEFDPKTKRYSLGLALEDAYVFSVSDLRGSGFRSFADIVEYFNDLHLDIVFAASSQQKLSRVVSDAYVRIWIVPQEGMDFIPEVRYVLGIRGDGLLILRKKQPSKIRPLDFLMIQRVAREQFGTLMFRDIDVFHPLSC